MTNNQRNGSYSCLLLVNHQIVWREMYMFIAGGLSVLKICAMTPRSILVTPLFNLSEEWSYFSLNCILAIAWHLFK